jgi:hypothetical protein
LPASGSSTMDRNSVVRPDVLAMSWMEPVINLQHASQHKVLTKNKQTRPQQNYRMR